MTRWLEGEGEEGLGSQLAVGFRITKFIDEMIMLIIFKFPTRIPKLVHNCTYLPNAFTL